MRRSKYFSTIVPFLVMVLGLIVASPIFDTAAFAYSSEDPLIVVSMGDSYSAGEGIEPFYGQELERKKKMCDYDWLAHRSKLGWPAQLEFQGIDGPTSLYRSWPKVANDMKCKWYFVAASGAETSHVFYPQQKMSRTYAGWFCWNVEYTNLPTQISVYNFIDDPVSYVTMTIGGNDVNFSDIITTCVTRSTYLGSNKLKKELTKTFDNMDKTKADLKETYEEISKHAGPQATIIVAGYPKLLEQYGQGAAISQEEALNVDASVSEFNRIIKDLVAECRSEGMDIYFVDVEEEFDKDGGHLAFSDDPWINGIVLGAQDQDIDSLAIVSDYSLHPNEQGAQAYARCVNAKIREIEQIKRKGTLSGKICKASDRSTPVTDATITVYKDDALFLKKKANETGNYTVTLPEGSYRVDVTAEGYLTFSAYATVTYAGNTYMETFLLVEGDENESGSAGGKITNALTGSGVKDVTLTVRKGWNNISIGEVVKTTSTQSNGGYSLSLPIGNYTMYAEREGFISSPINIIVLENGAGNQNGSITPNVTGNNYRIVLTWELNPRDLDSHVQGVLTDGNQFHVFYKHKGQKDGATAVCNLDVDNRYGYGPETITLNTINDEPYYYYVHRYNGSGSVSSSGAQVKVYQGETQVATFNVPVDQGTSDYWNVFAIVNGQLKIKNTISNSPDISYAKE